LFCSDSYQRDGSEVEAIQIYEKEKKIVFLPVSYGAKYLQWCNHFNDAYFINLVHHFLSLDYNVVKYQV